MTFNLLWLKMTILLWRTEHKHCRKSIDNITMSKNINKTASAYNFFKLRRSLKAAGSTWESLLPSKCLKTKKLNTKYWFICDINELYGTFWYFLIYILLSYIFIHLVYNSSSKYITSTFFIFTATFIYTNKGYVVIM